jgi:hypothetical protein
MSDIEFSKWNQKNIILGQSINIVAQLMSVSDSDKDYAMMTKLLFQRVPEMYNRITALREELGLTEFKREIQLMAKPIDNSTIRPPNPGLRVIAENNGTGLKINEDNKMKVD